MKLLELVDELLVHVLSSIEDRYTYLALSLTCKRLRILADEFLYRDILILDGSQAKHLYSAYQTDVRRAKRVRNLTIRHVAERQDGIEELNPMIRQMSNLRSLHLETPCCNDKHSQSAQGGNAEWLFPGRINVAAMFSEASLLRSPSERILTNLRSVIYHSHGEGRHKYRLPDRSLFLHPTLKYIKISCTDMIFDTPMEAANMTRTTPLETLEFEECNISVEALTDILRFPRGLRSLTLGERYFHFHIADIRRLESYTSHTLGALALQRHSLEYLKHTGGLNGPNLPVDSRAFCHALGKVSTMVLDTNSFMHQHLQTGAHPPMLRTLKLTGIPSNAVQYLEAFYDQYYQNWLPPKRSLSNIAPPEYTLQLSLYPEVNSDGIAGIFELLWSSHLSRSKILMFGRGLLMRLCKLEIYATAAVPFIPPYMYGEKIPVEHLAYDNTNPHVFGNETAQPPGAFQAIEMLLNGPTAEANEEMPMSDTMSSFTSIFENS